MLPEVIKMTRKKALLSQDAFARELNVSVPTVVRWESGKVKPNITAMRSIKDFCEKHDLPYDPIQTEWIKCSIKNK